MVSYSAIGDGSANGNVPTSREGSETGRGRRSVGPFAMTKFFSKIFPTSRRRRSFKDTGFAGEASWMSSNINLINTSMPSYLYLQISN
jgi:hypothetical protein